MRPGNQRGLSARLQLISEETRSELFEFLDYGDNKTPAQWQRLASSWFKEPEARRIIVEHLDALELGRIRRRAGTPDWKPAFDLFCERWESDADPGDGPAHVPGLLFWLRREFRRQAGLDQDALLQSGQQLDVQGNRKAATKKKEKIRFSAYAIDVFIQDLKPGDTVVVKGPKGGGKTQFAIEHLAVPWIHNGGVVVSNIKVFNPPPEYVHAYTMDRAMVGCLQARVMGKRVFLLIDEGATNRGRSNSQRRENKVQKDNSAWTRKMGITEGYIYHREADIASELAEWADYTFRKFGQDERTKVHCDTPVLGDVLIDDLPSIQWLKEHGRPVLDFDTDDPAPYDANLDIVSIVRSVFASAPLNDTGVAEIDWLRGVLEIVKDALEGPRITEPMTVFQLHWTICHMHVRDTQAKPITYVHLFRVHFEAAGFRNDDAARRLIMEVWKIVSHPNDPGRWCTFCRMWRKGFRGRDKTAPPTPEEIAKFSADEDGYWPSPAVP